MAVLPITERKGWEVGLKEATSAAILGPLTVQIKSPHPTPSRPRQMDGLMERLPINNSSRRIDRSMSRSNSLFSSYLSALLQISAHRSS